MATTKLIRRYRHAARDFAVGLGTFTTAVVAGLGSPCCLLATVAHARRFENEPLPYFTDQPAAAVSAVHSIWPSTAGGSQILVFATLAVAFATIFAVNLWFARHVRRVYVSSRRRG